MKNVLICDANHGGLTLLDEYSKFTNNNLFFFDIYHKLDENRKNRLSDKYNVTFMELEEIKEKEEEFVVVAPIHMPPVIHVDYTHHEFTSYLIRKRFNYNFKIIQVTGVKGKSSTTQYINNLLSQANILMLNSDSLTYNNKILDNSLSITPASIIDALNIAEKKNLIDKIDYCIFEVSLGVIPNCHINILTNILEDYPVSDDTKSAHLCKESVFTSKYILCDYDSLNNYYKSYNDDNIYSVGLSDKANISANNIKYNIDNTTFRVNYFDSYVDFECNNLRDFQINNMLFAIGVGLILNIDISTIKDNLSKSIISNKRGSYKKVNNKLIIEDINPGLNTTSIKKCIDNLNNINKEHIIIIGGDYGITCEEIDEEKLVYYINSLKNYNIILTGDLGKNIHKKTIEKYSYINNINDALKEALQNKKCEVIQIIYRSKYDRNINLKYD